MKKLDELIADFKDLVDQDFETIDEVDAVLMSVGCEFISGDDETDQWSVVFFSIEGELQKELVVNKSNLIVNFKD